MPAVYIDNVGERKHVYVVPEPLADAHNKDAPDCSELRV
jgi:hypothetical protein